MSELQAESRFKPNEGGLYVDFKGVINGTRDGYDIASNVEINDITGKELIAAVCALVELIINGAGKEDRKALLKLTSMGLMLLAAEPGNEDEK